MSNDSKVDFTNLTTIKEFCKALVKDGNLQTQDDLYGTDGVIKQIQKSLHEALLEGELVNYQLSVEIVDVYSIRCNSFNLI